MSRSQVPGRLVEPVGEADHVAGKADAPVTLVEYGDYQCPYCGAAYPVVKELQRKMGKRLRFVFRNFPLGEIHQYALHAAETAEAAAAAGKFWPMHDLLFERQRSLEDESLLKYAAELGLDPMALAKALAAGTFHERVRHDFMTGVRSGVNGTPTFFINGRRHDGGYDAASLLAALEEAK